MSKSRYSEETQDLPHVKIALPSNVTRAPDLILRCRAKEILPHSALSRSYVVLEGTSLKNFEHRAEETRVLALVDFVRIRYLVLFARSLVKCFTFRGKPSSFSHAQFGLAVLELAHCGLCG